MSLINDALKRAREADQGRAGGCPPTPQLQPVDYVARPNRAGWIVLTVLLLATLGLAAFYLGRWAGSPTAGHVHGSAKERAAVSPASTEALAPRPDGPAIDTNRDLLAHEAPTTRSDPVVVPASRTAADPLPAMPAPGGMVAERAETEQPGSLGEHAPGPVDPAPEAEPQFPELRLQSIVFRLRNPSVVINGEMLSAGDTVDGARVAKIERHAVTMEWRGQTNILRLPQF